MALKNNLCGVTDRLTDRKVLGFGFGYLLQITDNRRYSSVGYLITDRTQNGLQCPTLPVPHTRYIRAVPTFHTKYHRR